MRLTTGGAVRDSSDLVTKGQSDDDDEEEEEEEEEEEILCQLRSQRGDLVEPSVLLRLPNDPQLIVKGFDLKRLTKYVGMFVSYFIS